MTGGSGGSLGCGVEVFASGLPGTRERLVDTVAF